MDIEEYISSGVLELYAAGALPDSEKAAVEQTARQYPDVQAELDLIQDSLERYATLHAVSPPVMLKSKVLGAISQTTILTDLEPGEVKTTSFQQEPDNYNLSGRVIQMKMPEAETSNFWKWAVAASVALLVFSNILSVYFYNNWKDSENRLQLAMLEQQQFAQNLQQVNQRLSSKQVALTIISNPTTRRVDLKGVKISPESAVTVFWHRETQKVFVAVKNLPTPPTDKQYQLWALVDGKPVDAGVITDLSDLQAMKEMPEAQAFAITLEPKGGSINPTLEQMYVIGNVKA